MSDYSHADSMDDALALYRGVSISAEDLVKAAEMIRLYKNNKLTVSINGYSQRGSFPVDDSNGLREDVGDFLPGHGTGERAVCIGELLSDVVNQPLAGELVCGHQNDSSKKQNTRGQELPTPGSTETVVSGGGTVTGCSTHGRTDGMDCP